MLIFVHVTVKSVILMKLVFFWKLNDEIGSNILLFSISRNHFSSLVQQSLCNFWQYLKYYKSQINFCCWLLHNRVHCTIYQYKNSNKFTQWCYSGRPYSDLHHFSVLDICNYKALFRCPYLSTPWVKIYYFTKYHRSINV